MQYLLQLHSGALADHKIISLSESSLDIMKIAHLCPNHLENVIASGYCDDCDIDICKTCNQTYHNGHRILEQKTRVLIAYLVSSKDVMIKKNVKYEFF